MKNPQTELFEQAARMAKDPLKWAKFAFPWGEKGGPLEKDNIREWQEEVLAAIRDHLNGPDRFQPLQIARSSGHGIGKSALIGMITHWALSTMIDTRVLVTANTDTQLRTKTVPEVTRWFNMSINRNWFNPMATSVTVVDEKHAINWRADFTPWSIKNTEAFQGLHNKDKRIILIYDEGSGIDDLIYQVSEGALTDENTEIIWIVFGNPTRNTGRFKACFTKFRHRWNCKKIDARDVEGTNKVQIAKWVKDYGEDSDFVKVRVRGEFPTHSSNQLISEDTVDACRQLQAHGYESFPIRIGVDIAGEGENSDDTVICVAQGNKIHEMKRYNGLDTVQVYTKCVEAYDYWKKKNDRIMLLVDAIGIGYGVSSMLKRSGIPTIGIVSGSQAKDPERYTNLRIEMWWDMAQGLKEGWDLTALSQEEYTRLKDDLTNIEYFENPQTQKYQLEAVDDLKARDLPSPDFGSALAFTVAFPVPHIVQSSLGKIEKADQGARTVKRMRGKSDGLRSSTRTNSRRR